MAFGVYVHVPFCARRCDYCDFATWTDRHHLMEAYSAACVRDLTRRCDTQPVPPATSVFFGGGTPSLLPADLLVGILDAVPRAPDCEVTVECNPDTVTPALLDAYRAGGVNRLSFGVQSMAPHVLAGLGRTHDPAGVEQAVGYARASGFDNFNVDLIYGAAGGRRPTGRRPSRRPWPSTHPTSAPTPSPSNPEPPSPGGSEPGSYPPPTTTTRPRSTWRPPTLP